MAFYGCAYYSAHFATYSETWKQIPSAVFPDNYDTGDFKKSYFSKKPATG